MSREAELLDAMFEAPDDPGPRMVYADLLLDRDSRFGELVRLQRDARPGETSAAAVRGSELEKAFLAELRAAAIVANHGLSPVTGWPFQLAMSAATFLENLELVFAIGPLHSLRLHHVSPYLEELARCRQLRWVQGLELAGNELDSDDVAQIVGSPHVARLGTLDLSRNRVGVAGAIAVAEAPFERLRALQLDHAWLGNDGVARLAGSAHLPGLELLGLTSNEIDATALAGVLASARSLTALFLSYNPDLGPEAVRAIAAAEQLRLTSLSITACDVRNPGARTLANAISFGALEWLELDRNNITSKGARELAASTTLPKTRLSIDENPAIDAAAYALLRSRFSVV